MTRGRKGNLDNPVDNVSTLPGCDGERSDQWHEDQAAQLMPTLRAAEKKIWNVVAPELSRAGRLKALYVDVIAQYCVVYVRLNEARKTLDKKEWTYVTEGRHGDQIKSRPEVAQLNDDWRKWRSLVGELGLSPSAERGLQQVQGDLFDNEFAALERG